MFATKVVQNKMVFEANQTQLLNPFNNKHVQRQFQFQRDKEMYLNGATFV